MEWFEGAIPQAIAESKQHKKIFLVYIAGEDDMSIKMEQTFNNSEVVKRLNNGMYVCLRLRADSQACRQFSQIYPVVVVPSTFFIDNGVPLEVVGGSTEPTDFITKIEKVVEAHKKNSENDNNTSNIQKPSDKYTGPQPSTSVDPCSYDSCDIEKPSSSSSTAESNSSPLKERVDRAKELLEIRRDMKASDEKAKEKNDEISRRHMGKEMQKAQRERQDNELKEWARERAKEKEEERLARERVLAQIAQDRLERAARYQSQKAVEEQVCRQKEQDLKRKADQEVLADAAERSKIARIQFRLPDGSSVTHQFDAGATLNEARQFVVQEVRPGFSSFTFSTTFPRRQFVENDYSQTLRDLDLAPSAAILILPGHAHAPPVPVEAGSGLTNMLMFILSPLFNLWNFVNNFLFGVGAPATGSSTSSGSSTSTNSNTVSSNSNASTSDDPEASNLPSTSHTNVLRNRRSVTNTGNFLRKEGNIFRISNQGNDEDDNNTYNGNSTQQM